MKSRVITDQVTPIVTDEVTYCHLWSNTYYHKVTQFHWWSNVYWHWWSNVYSHWWDNMHYTDLVRSDALSLMKWHVMTDVVTRNSSSLLIGRRPVYTSVSLHLFIGRPQVLYPTGIPSCTLLTKRSSAIREMCRLYSIFLLCTQEVMFWISNVSRILSFFILSIRV
jgi:hypothetical protein